MGEKWVLQICIEYDLEWVDIAIKSPWDITLPEFIQECKTKMEGIDIPWRVAIRYDKPRYNGNEDKYYV